MQTSEKLLDADLVIDRASCCWKFYNRSIAQTTAFRSHEPIWEELALTQYLLPMFLGLSDFLRSTRSLNEIWKFYVIVISVISDLRKQPCQNCHTTWRPSPATGCGRRSHAREPVKNCAHIRSRGFLLTIAFLMNGVLSVHHPDSSDLVNFR